MNNPKSSTSLTKTKKRFATWVSKSKTAVQKAYNLAYTSIKNNPNKIESRFNKEENSENAIEIPQTKEDELS